MRCTHCGTVIPEGRMHCPRCGKEVQIVPDYNPLDDVVTQEVRGSVRDATRQIHTDDIRSYAKHESIQQKNATRVLSESEMEDIRKRREQAIRGRNLAEHRRRQQAERKKRLIRRRRKLIIAMLLVVLLIGGLLGLLFYQNSYSGRVRKGYEALQAKEYDRAEDYFNRAIGKNSRRAEAYAGLAEVYMAKEQPEEAESVFLSAVASQPSSVEIYKAAIAFYENNKQPEKIAELLSDCDDDRVLESVAEYVSEAPAFSLDEGSYEEVQEVTLSAEGGTIYYTTDGTVPTSKSTKYTEPILIDTEGETVIKAVSYNQKKVPSVVVTKSYKIELPIEDAPAVTPSTGKYTAPTQITINVPEGYTAYYTLDGSEPGTENPASQVYAGPIDMPQGQTLFSAVLVNKNGKHTQITKRNYTYEP